MKINYDIRASFEETLDDDVSCILKLFSDKDVSKLSIAEIPTNKDRNILLHKYFKKVGMYDINQQVIQSLKDIIRERYTGTIVENYTIEDFIVDLYLPDL